MLMDLAIHQCTVQTTGTTVNPLFCRGLLPAQDPEGCTQRSAEPPLSPHWLAALLHAGPYLSFLILICPHPPSGSSLTPAKELA